MVEGAGLLVADVGAEGLAAAGAGDGGRNGVRVDGEVRVSGLLARLIVGVQPMAVESAEAVEAVRELVRLDVVRNAEERFLTEYLLVLHKVLRGKKSSAFIRNFPKFYMIWVQYLLEIVHRRRCG
jgi:hypothetical protein